MLGIDRCSGFCTAGVCDMPDETPRCAETDEARTTSANCCNDADSCIAGFCSHVRSSNERPFLSAYVQRFQ
jgi:hypothetical protein